MPSSETMDMRYAEDGSVLDQFHFEMWAGFLSFAGQQDQFLDEFLAETGTRLLLRSPANAIEMAIDKACGFNRAQEDAFAQFASWVTDKYWGDETDLTPSIARKLGRELFPANKDQGHA